MNDTLITAINILDRYLVQLLVAKKPKPPQKLLVATVTLLAAKFCEATLPSFRRVIRLMLKTSKVLLSWQDIKDLEEDILLRLNFDFNFVSSLEFLERYQRVFSLDKIRGEDPDATAVISLARTICILAISLSTYLELKPSRLAAASITLAINLFTCQDSPVSNCTFLQD